MSSVCSFFWPTLYVNKAQMTQLNKSGVGVSCPVNDGSLLTFNDPVRALLHCILWSILTGSKVANANDNTTVTVAS